mmetsp:Transcript_59723/g.167363  ORF Transcript_59723/g.167363 Transcript_59723/m.167363 type:complete len:327 (-) Transcript_59723:100-1080(-)
MLGGEPGLHRLHHVDERRRGRADRGDCRSTRLLDQVGADLPAADAVHADPMVRARARGVVIHLSALSAGVLALQVVAVAERGAYALLLRRDLVHPLGGGELYVVQRRSQGSRRRRRSHDPPRAARRGEEEALRRAAVRLLPPAAHVAAQPDAAAPNAGEVVLPAVCGSRRVGVHLLRLVRACPRVGDVEGRGEGCRHLAEDLGLRRDLRLDDLVCGDARFAGELEDDLEVRGHQGGCAVVHLPGDDHEHYHGERRPHAVHRRHPRGHPGGVDGRAPRPLLEHVLNLVGVCDRRRARDAGLPGERDPELGPRAAPPPRAHGPRAAGR